MSTDPEKGWTGKPCPKCNGCGAVIGPDGEERTCQACAGTGEEYGPLAPAAAEERPCTCHPDDRPTPCAKQYALGDCLAVASGMKWCPETARYCKCEPRCGEFPAAETAEREAERRFPSTNWCGQTISSGLVTVERAAFLAGATWQREQDALSGGERAEVLKVLESCRERFIRLWGLGLDRADIGEMTVLIDPLAARLRSAPSEAAPSLAPEQRGAGGRAESVPWIVRSNLEAIIIRCTEGDKKSDWLPVIHRLADEALRYWPELAALPHPACWEKTP